jgi:hypothetical protein
MQCLFVLDSRFGQGHCYFGTRCTFAHGPEECAYWTELYQIQTVQLTQLENERLLTESLSEKVRRRIQNEGSHVVSTIYPSCGVFWFIFFSGSIFFLGEGCFAWCISQM